MGSLGRSQVIPFLLGQHIVLDAVDMAKKKSEDLPRLSPNFKLWLEYNGEYVLGPGAYALLKSIHTSGSITQAALELKMSYRYAWGVIRKVESTLKAKVIESYKGGSKGGGGAKVTPYGISLMELYARVNHSFSDVIDSLE
ncbi:MAG: winged helix-turn-helix domain-containing protein [Candidatus Thorarchaeota archaeon]